MTLCPCISFTYEGSGGLLLNGSATVPKKQVGGLRFGGSANYRSGLYDGLVFILPLDEAGNGTQDEFRDRTNNELHGTGGGGLNEFAPMLDQGVFCLGSQRFDGREYISLPPDTLDTNQEFSLSLWVRLRESGMERGWYSRGIEADGFHWTFNIGNTVLNHVWASIQQVGEELITTYAFSVKTLGMDRFYHIGATFDRKALRIYIDGELADEIETPVLPMPDINKSQLGRFSQGQGLTGNLQEVRLHSKARSQAWLRAEKDNFCLPGFFVQGQTMTATYG